MTLGFLVLRDFRWVCIVKPVPGVDSTLIIKIVGLAETAYNDLSASNLPTAFSL